jgi:hypothetical protein
MRKGIIFSLDAFLAVGLFMIVVLSIYIGVLDSGNVKQQYYMSNDIINILLNVNIDDLDDILYSDLKSVVDAQYTGRSIGTVLILMKDNENDILTIINDLFPSVQVGERYGVGLKVEGEEILVINKKFLVGKTSKIPIA